MCFRVVGGEAVLRETVRGTPDSERERNRLPHRSVCDGAAGLRPAGGGEPSLSLHTFLWVLHFVSSGDVHPDSAVKYCN